jgi:hypothetical protein
MVIVVSMAIFLMGFCGTIWAISTAEEQVGFWSLRCNQRKFPSESIAKRFLNGDRFPISYCEAEQTVYETSNHIPVLSKMKLTPARVLFEIHSIDQIKKNAKLGLGQEKIWYELFVNCYPNSHESICLLFPSGKWVDEALARIQHENSEAVLSFVDQRTNERLLISFDLTGLQWVYPRVASTYQQMKQILDEHPEYQASFHEII